jgi:ligand-binding SRPBCC domain-containing protein
MRTQFLERRQVVARPLDEVFEFFSRASNLELLTPRSLSFRLITPEPIEMRTGTLIEYRLRVHGLPLHWVSRIENWEDGHGFVDRQLRGPYRFWLHRHGFEAVGSGTEVRDRVEYALPLGVAGEIVALPFVRRDLARIFDYRRQVVAERFG